MMGEKVGAVIVPLPGASVDPRGVVAYARRELADFKVPPGIIHANSLVARRVRSNGAAVDRPLSERLNRGRAGIPPGADRRPR
jgi:hypothetical protein